MPIPTLSNAAHVLRSLLHLVARPLRGAQGRGGLVIHPYRGYGSRGEVYLMGRVFRQPELGAHLLKAPLLRDLVDVFRRFARWGVAGAEVTLRLGDAETVVTTDANGFFQAHFRPGPLDERRAWHPVELEMTKASGDAVKAEGEVFVPPSGARYVVISDIDDTVVFTGVANFVGMLWRLFAQGAESRVAFPGVGALYRALYDGASGGERNPLLYVSRGPWSIYDVLEAFFDLHNIPVGPVLFLRYWGLTLQHPLPRRAKGHKQDLIERMLALYEDLPFILLGDSGQHDPETYAQVVRDHPGRVLAIYIRNVSRDDERLAAIEALAKDVAEAGSSLVLAADSFTIAEHAAEHGFISREALDEVLRERTEQEEEEDAGLKPTVEVAPETAEETKEAIERGVVEASLDREAGEEPPNVTIESKEAEADTQHRPPS